MGDPPSPTSTIDDLEADNDPQENNYDDYDDVRSEIISSAPPIPAVLNAGPTSTRTADAAPSAINRHFVDAPPSRTGTFDTFRHPRDRRRHRDAALRAYAGWEKQPPAEARKRGPYHEYVHSLVEGGWDMMQDLDKYLETDIEDPQLTISILDIASNAEGVRRWPDLHDEADLGRFMAEQSRRPSGSVRLYLTEQRGGLAAGVIEALGSGLDLDPRFFQWSLVGHKHVLAPSHRHHAPYVRIGFGVPRLSTPNRTDADRFNVTIYVKPDDQGSGWTGILLFSSHNRVHVSPYNLFPPPAYTAARPPLVQPSQRSFRELFLAVYPSLNLVTALKSPFYAIHVLLRLNYVTWSDVINSIRTEDRRIHSISDTSVGHAEEITKSLAVVQRGGSLAWKGRDVPETAEVQAALEEDFRHLVQETEFLWQEREKMAAVRQRRSENRWTLLTNIFTYVFAPVTIISGIYGMNVQEIVGTEPDIWQFFVAVAILNVVVLIGLAIANWIHILKTHKRRASWQEVIGFVLGRTKHS